jgi:hypothetical protein
MRGPSEPQSTVSPRTQDLSESLRVREPSVSLLSDCSPMRPQEPHEPSEPLVRAP